MGSSISCRPTASTWLRYICRQKKEAVFSIGAGRRSVSQAAHMYWIATSRPDSRPHVMPVWGVWLDDVFYFSSGRQSRKVRNLAKNAHCVVSVEDGTDCVVVEGEAEEVSSGPLHAAISDAYLAKYQSDLSELGEPIYAVHPTVAFGLQESDFVGSATRWKFSAAKTR